jgi:hypothetical protein
MCPCGLFNIGWQSHHVGLTITFVPSAQELLPLTIDMSATAFSQNFRQQFIRRPLGLDFACLLFSMDLFPSIGRDEKLQTDVARPRSWLSTLRRKQVRQPCTNRVLMNSIEAIWVNLERRADSPNCWKQYKPRCEMESSERLLLCPRQVRYQAALRPDMTGKIDSKVLSNAVTTANHDFFLNRVKPRWCGHFTRRPRNPRRDWWTRRARRSLFTLGAKINSITFVFLIIP